jgi:hypothetical protein
MQQVAVWGLSIESRGIFFALDDQPYSCSARYPEKIIGSKTRYLKGHEKRHLCIRVGQQCFQSTGKRETPLNHWMTQSCMNLESD